MRLDNPFVAVLLIALGMALIPLNDAAVSLLDQGQGLSFAGNAITSMTPLPLMEIITLRALIGLIVLVFIPGAIAGVLALSGSAWLKLIFRGGLLVGSMCTYFLGLTIFQLWEMTAIFFICPVLISLLAVPILGERLGVWRILAVFLGFAGVLVILVPKLGADTTQLGWNLLFPIGSAIFYASYQIFTRLMRNEADALVMSVVQILAYFGFGLVLGLALWALPASYSEGTPGAFLFRDWVWPNWTQMGLIGMASAIVLFLSFVAANAYRVAEAAYVAPFEYAAMPFSILWSGVIWGQWPDLYGYGGTVLIVGAGLLIIFRERKRDVDVVTSMPMTRSGAFAVAAVDERDPIWVSPEDRLI